MEPKLPTEVELLFELMPCQALRYAQEPGLEGAHPCSYFRKWGYYHSFDYREAGPPPVAPLVQLVYRGKSRLLPEPLTGCRKAPILAVGINPNLPGWYSSNRRALNPDFDEYRQYAHYFRFRSVSKLAVDRDAYNGWLGGAEDTPESAEPLAVPPDEEGQLRIPVEAQDQKMYIGYQDLLVTLAERMAAQDDAWAAHQFSIGEDLAYANMVACPSARWTTRPLTGSPDDEAVQPMTLAERNGIVTECFRRRKYFLRQLYQSLPKVLLVFSQNTANALVGELGHRFFGERADDGTQYKRPEAGESIESLIGRMHWLEYGRLPDGKRLAARVIFSPHISGNPVSYQQARDRVVAQLVEEAESGNLTYNPQTRHLSRSRGACYFCPTFEIGPPDASFCWYRNELEPISLEGAMLMAGRPPDRPAGTEEWVAEKLAQGDLLRQVDVGPRPVAEAWAGTDGAGEP